MDSWLSFLESIVRKASDAIMPLLGTSEGNVDMGTGAGGDVTKKIDAVAEDAILSELEGTGLAMKIITEERGIIYINCSPEEDETIEIRAIIDPIDGSVNATRNLPFFAVSIAIANGTRLKDITDAVVLNVATGDVMTASRGQGSWLNGIPLSLAEASPRLQDALMGIDLNPKKGEFVRGNLIGEFAALVNAPRKIRVLGSNALELALVATGALDCFVDVRGSLRILDIAAAWLIVKEAGGHVFEFRSGSTRVLDDLELGLGTRMAMLAASTLELKDEIEIEWKKCLKHGR
ncbi:MAG TPA: inositol monophosphatase family protein [Candidatus Lokiarchaeia archaeon]|nr:inositol monophosphatase family protein [Candidatus Lokiarchaeia archaeon]